jgi:hypothetical protein
MSKELKFTGITLIVLAISAFVFTQFLQTREEWMNRWGMIIDDPFYDFLPLQEHSSLIFSITYGSVLLYGSINFRNPSFASRAILSYSLILLFRIPTMLLVPLKVHPDLIFLQDPFLNELIYPSKIVNDLFFSGHIALICIFCLVSRFKFIFVILAIVLAVLLLMQRVHYSMDVIGAIPFAWLAVRLSDLLHEKAGLNAFM